MKIILIFLSIVSVVFTCQDTGCPDGQSCNPYTDQCVVDPPPPARPAAWLGDEPDFCNRSPDDCKHFNLEYDISHPKGDGDFCENGTKIRCLIGENKPELENSPDNELRVIAYNVFERSFQITWDGQRERTCRLPFELLDKNRDVDVITFQEVFMGGCFAESLNIRQILTYYGFPYFTDLLESDDVPSNGGIFIASKWPIVEQDMHIYNASDENTWDWFAAKGVSYAKIKKGDTFYHVTGTHMQAGGSSDIKPKQCQETADFLKTKSIPQSEPIVYSGDFNLNQWSSNTEALKQCVQFLDAEIPPNEGPLNATSDPNTNDVLNLTTSNPRPGSWLDYVMPNIAHKRPTSAVQIVLKPIGTPAFPVCWCEQCISLDPDYIYPDDEDCDRVERIQDLSDHYPVLGVFKYD
ncbi:DgyrCDS4791 [Dimorphilus gyrociliatus]|uniref:sphingomyelin phosphodiesterase n=1 Tax=Dimorphilus gyrociliatus TaxID=2664684 RepID=A0A7I8VHM5_9ANNE|nr:DgyrCDS4791 [Dimorphilus gyrociliatus]